MKKLLVLLGILAAFSTVACNNNNTGTSDAVDTGNNGATEVVIFDPATYEGEGVEIVDLDGEKFAKVVVDGYSSYIKFPTALKDLSIKKIKGKIKVEKGDAAAIQWAAQFMGADNSGQAASFNGNTFDEVKEFESNWGPDYSYTDYNNGGVTAYGVNSCESIQVYAQDSSYSAVTGAIIYVGKIIGE